MEYKQMFIKLSTSIEMKVFIYSHLFCGNYFKAFSSKTASFLLRLYCFLFTITILKVCSANIHNRPLLYSSTTNLFETTIAFIISQVTSQKYLITFYNNLNTFDRLIGFKSQSNFLKKSFLLVFTINVLMILSGAITTLSKIIIKSAGVSTYLSFILLWILTQLRYCKSGLIISLMHHRLKLLRKYIEKNNVPVSIIGRERINEHIHVVRKSLIYYDNLLDAFDAIDNFMQVEVVLIYVFYLPRPILYLHFWISSYLDNHYFMNLTTIGILIMLLDFILASSSCIMMYFSNSESEKIKKTLVLQIIGCSDVSLREELENLLQHVTRRPFRFTLLRAVPVDLYLPISIMSTAITYVIIALQFTHFGHSSKFST